MSTKSITTIKYNPLLKQETHLLPKLMSGQVRVKNLKQTADA